jgi:small-conductance mechanosensitive channel
MEEELRTFLENPFFIQTIIVLVGLFIITILARTLQRTVVTKIQDPSNRYRGRKFVTFLGYITAIILIAAVFRERLGGLSVTLGIAGAGIAFALQEVITSVAGWIAISFGDFYSPGDRVEVGGIRGDVIDVSILRTTLMEIGEWVQFDQYTGRIVRVTNSFIFKEPVINYSTGFPFIWDEVKMPVSYESDHNLARSIFQNIGYELTGQNTESARTDWKKMRRRYMLEKASLEPTVFMIATDNWLEFSIRYLVDLKERRSVKDQFFTRILDEFNKTEGRVSVASTTLKLTNTSKLEVRSPRDSDNNRSI